MKRNISSAEAARVLAAQRQTFGGGRAASCECGTCAKCRKRAAMRKYRDGLKKAGK